MKKILRLSVILVICLLLLLGTTSFSIITQTDAMTPKTVFTFSQSSPGISEISVFGYQSTWDLTPLLRVRQWIADFFFRIPTQIGHAVSFVFEGIFSIFAS